MPMWFTASPHVGGKVEIRLQAGDDRELRAVASEGTNVAVKQLDGPALWGALRSEADDAIMVRGVVGWSNGLEQIIIERIAKPRELLSQFAVRQADDERRLNVNSRYSSFTIILIPSSELAE